jgi:SEC-C motif
MAHHPRKKTGRNDPCPCGGGKKYKHCCLLVAPASEDSRWRRQRDASDRLTQEMLNFARSRFGNHIPEAWLDFNQDELPIPLDEDAAEGQIFLPYFLFDWDPERPSPQREDYPRMGLVARSYLLKAGSRLAELDRSILEQATTQPLSFYEVVGCDPGERMVLRDVLIGGETEVVERKGSAFVRPGDLVYGQLCKLPEVATLGRLAPLCIPPREKVEIVGLRAELRKKIARKGGELTAADLNRFAEEVRGTYLDIRDAMREPPQLDNTDGDPILFHTLTFRTGSAHAAFEALAPLAWGVSKDELLDTAEVDDDGALRSAEIPWLKKGNRQIKQWENTILGQLKISGRSLVAEVNSERRATRLRQEIEKRLGILAIHQSTVAQTPEAMLEKWEQRGDASSSADHDGPPLDPEVIEHAKAEMQRLVESWIYKKIPVLGGRTPLQAISDPDGKEIVESLLLDWERKIEQATMPGILRPDIDVIRRLLNLAPSMA